MKYPIPHLRQAGDTKQLIVNGEPFLILGGEVQNSQFSSAAYMQDVWHKLKAANLNTVFGSVAWEQIEPIEDHFVFDEIDQIIVDARGHDMHLVLLWFGSYKNALSTYTPSWVKQNPNRFPRAEVSTQDGKTKIADALSVFGEEARKADAKAFAAFMSHLKDVDEGYSTVVMVQVQNEVGLLGDSRDRSQLAQIAWQRSIPEGFIEKVQAEWLNHNSSFQSNFAELEGIGISSIKNWSDTPCQKILVEELFMAYHFAEYVETVAMAGKAAYPLPLYTNVWQNYADESRDKSVVGIAAGGDKPGDYPSGGGVANTFDIWKLFAPALDIVAPDIYLNDYAISCATYRHRRNPLIIPEQRRDEYGARRIWTAFGNFKAIGVAPFGIDSLELDENPFQLHYDLLSRVSKHILDAQAGKLKSVGFFFDELREDGTDPSAPVQAMFGKWHLSIERAFVFGKPSPASGMIIQMSENEFLLIGWGFQVSWTSEDPRVRFIGLLRFEEKVIVDKASGKMKTLRLLNGDETISGTVARMPAKNPDYGGFPIAITIPAKTGIALCEPYALLEEQ